MSVTLRTKMAVSAVVLAVTITGVPAATAKSHNWEHTSTDEPISTVVESETGESLNAGYFPAQHFNVGTQVPGEKDGEQAPSGSKESSELDEKTKKIIGGVVGGIVAIAALVGLVQFAGPFIQQFLQDHNIIPSAQPQGVSQRERDYAAQFMRELNGYRVSKGLRPVMEDRNLSNGSYNWSKHMYHVGRITHSHGPFEELVFRALGDYVDDPSSAINVWKSDPGVNANLLDPRARAGGIGFYIKDGWIYATYRYVR